MECDQRVRDAKSQSLKTEVAQLNKRVEELEHTLNILQHGSLEEATALLASIRLNAEGSSSQNAALDGPSGLSEL